MRTLGNIVWIVTGGLVTAALWLLAGVVFSITIVGIPLGRQAFKMAKLTLTPFGLSVTYGGGFPSLVANVVWVLLIGIWEALLYAVMGAILCITVVGMPFGIQLFKMAKLSLLPFGSKVE